MDYKKSKAPVNTVTRNIMDLCKDTDNIYESVAIIAKRANQISAQIKEDLSKKLAEFASYNDSLEEVDLTLLREAAEAHAAGNTGVHRGQGLLA